MAIIDPKEQDPAKVSRIIHPDQSPDAIAARKLATRQNIENNPVFQAIMDENKRMRKDMSMLAGQMKAITTRFHAVMDYLSKTGVLLNQPLDEEGFADGPPITPDEAQVAFWDGLKQHNIVDMPAYGIEAYLAEHMRLGDFITQIGQVQLQHGATMEEMIEKAREFNSEPRRLVKVRGDHFGLDAWLNENPNELSDEEQEALAKEFGLAKMDDEEPIAEE
jgi:hypothetical protein